MDARVLYIADHVTDWGQARQISLLASRLSSFVDVRVVVLNPTSVVTGELNAKGVRFDVIDWPNRFDLSKMSESVRLLRRTTAEILHVWNPSRFLQFMISACRHSTTKVVYSSTDSSDWIRCGPFRNECRRTTWGSIVYSTVKRVSGENRLDHATPTIVPSMPLAGVSVNESRARVTRREILDRFGLDQPAILFATVGKFDSADCLKHQVWALELLRAANDHVHLIISGSEPFLNRIRRYAELCGCRDNVHFWGGSDGVGALLPHLAAFWAGNRVHRQSQAILEATAVGTPVIACDSRDNRKIIVDGVTGFCVPFGNRAALARRSYYLMEHSVEAKKIAKCALEHTFKHFSERRFVERHIMFYQNVLQRQTRAA